ncbi:hypothetical protein V8D89_012928 [Ganoderma adspersum]
MLTQLLDGQLFGVLCSGVALTVLWKFVRSGSSPASALPLPPGPKPLPVVGNLFDIPTRRLGASFRGINERYGDVAHLSALGQSMIVLGSYAAACVLLEDRSANTSDRQRSVMAELTGYSSWEFALFGHNMEWRRHRRQFHRMFHKGAVVDYQPIQLEHSQRLLQRVVDDPEQFVSHIRHFFGSTIMRIVYGLEVAEKNDEYISLVERGVDVFIRITVPGRYLVEALPLLRNLPSWFPGAKFRRDAAEWKESVEAMRDVPFRAAKDKIDSGTFSHSVVSRMLEKSSLWDTRDQSERDELSRNIAAIAYITGADTTFSSVQAFILAMAMQPDIQRKAQAELDAVVGPRRLPHFTDRASLPYVNALVKECFRWQSVVPLGVPHRVSEDEEYNGYLIPKGSILIANQWAMSRDPVAYPDPDEFRPERFLDAATRDPMKYAFGFGRRICPGRHFADNSLFIIVAHVLHTLNVEPPLDGDGQTVELEFRYTTDMVVSYPKPFECRITPRADRADLISSERG